MVGDTSSQQATQKFSFVDLDLSKKSNRHQKASAAKNLVVDDDLEASELTVTEDNASSINSDWYDLDTAAYNLDIAEIIQQCAIDNSSQLSPKRSYLGKILFALACSYCLFILWWLFGHEGSKILTALTGGKQIVLTKSDVQFIDYMERSLDSIDRKIEANLDKSEDDIVYVPMYTPAEKSQIASNSLPSSIPNITYPQPPATVKPEPVAPQALKIPAPPPLPAPTPIPDDSSSVEVATKIEPVKHTLMGILELGENQSAALVKVKGKTTRVWLGQEIGNSGWILDSIENQNAKISSKGQVRSISVGETF